MRPFCTILFGLLVAIACDPPPPPDATPALGSRVELAAGDVWLKDGDVKKRLITGSMLPQKAGLDVGEGGRALVRLGTGAGAFLRGGTEAAIDDNSFVLKKGELWADIPAGEREMGRFVIGDVNVSASDAGLDISVKNGVVVVYVARGLAVVTAPGGRTEVQSGERVEVKGKGKLEVEPVAFWEDWTGGMADRELLGGMGGKAAGRIYGIDRARPGAQPAELQILSQEVHVVISDGIAHTVVDQRFFNPQSTPLEGWYWFTVPEAASVERFALEVNGVLVDGEMIERKQAAAAYEEAVQKAFDPALLEWIDGRTFRARIFPIPATGERRVVLTYSQLMPLADGVYRYVYPLAGSGDTAIQEFSLNVSLGDEGDDYSVATLQDARVEKDGKHISMRRSGFVPRADFLLELNPKKEIEPLRAMRFSTGKNEADYVMLRYAPEVEWNKLDKVPGDVVVVLDTSAGGDESDRQVKADAVEAILRALSSGDHFAVVAADLIPRVIFPAQGMAKADEQNVSAAVEKLSEIASAGATDLGEMFSVALDLLYDAEQPAVVYVGDGRPTVGETSSMELADRLRRALGDSRARLFTIAVGADANVSLLDRLARVGGGRSFRIDTPEQTVQEALRFVGLVKTPTITDLEIDAGSGLDQVFTTAAGKVSEGDEVILLARTHHGLPKKIKVRGRIGGEEFEQEYKTKVDSGNDYWYIPVLWARQYLDRLMGDGVEKNRGRIISLGLNYALMTPLTSFLVLENEAAYQQQGIQRHPRRRFSLIKKDNSGGTAVASATDVLAIPLGLFGCSEMDEPKMGDDESIAVLQRQRQDMPEMAEQGKLLSQLENMEKSGGDHASAGKLKERLVREMEEMPSPAPVTSASAAPRAEEGRMMAKSRRASAPKGEMSNDPLASFDLDGLVGGLGPQKIGTKGSGRGGGGGDFGEDKKRDSNYGMRGPGDASSLIASGDLNKDVAHTRPIFKTGVCSDASRRPLSQKRILWSRNLRRVTNANQYSRIFFEAGERCELPRWRDRKVMLDLIERRARTPRDVRGILGAFSSHARIQKYLRRRIMKRTLDPNVTMGLQFPDAVNWHVVLTGLAAIKTPEDRVTELRRILDKNPTDPIGRGMLVRTLVDLDMNEEALAEATRLRRDGVAGPMVIEILCDLEAAAGRIDEARRTCSELVEFNADDPQARQRLGDLFLRHGWYNEAYRQYTSLVNMLGDSATSLLRLAAAAAGMGKVDEALRIERKVAAGDGEPGPEDPRRWARLHSAARLAMMLLEAREKKEESKIRAIERSLKRTQVFGAHSTIAILVWEDFGANLVLLPKIGEDQFPVSQRIISNETGLIMLDLGQITPEELRLFVELEGRPLKRDVQFKLLTLGWDGKEFTIDQQVDKV
jgi:Ca-activated chloride channel homolog